MSNYFVHKTDITKSPIEVDEGFVDETTLDLALFGRIRLEYGERLNQNILNLLENFAVGGDGSLMPITPTPMPSPTHSGPPVTPTPTSSVGNTPQATSTPTPTATMTGTPIGATPPVTPTNTPTQGSSPTQTPAVTHTQTPVVTPTATPQLTPTSTITSTPAPTLTPTPSSIFFGSIFGVDGYNVWAGGGHNSGGTFSISLNPDGTLTVVRGAVPGGIGGGTTVSGTPGSPAGSTVRWVPVGQESNFQARLRVSGSWSAFPVSIASPQDGVVYAAFNSSPLDSVNGGSLPQFGSSGGNGTLAATGTFGASQTISIAGNLSDYDSANISIDATIYLDIAYTGSSTVVQTYSTGLQFGIN